MSAGRRTPMPYDIDECWVEIAFAPSLMQSTFSVQATTFNALDVGVMTNAI
jgi:hypothetical protein